MAERGDDYRLQRRETQADQDRCDYCHGNAETTDSLQERGEHPADDQGLHALIRREMGQGLPDGGDGSGFVGYTVEQKCSPYDKENIYGEQEGFCMGVRQQPGTSPEGKDGDQQGT